MNFFEHDAMQQCAVSYELLKLLQWLVEHDQEGLQQLVSRATSKGFSFELRRGERAQMTTDLQENIIEFFMVLEAMLHASLHDQSTRETFNAGIIPALKYVDTSVYQDTALSAGVAKATHASQHGKNTKEALCKELLKRWKPLKSAKIN